MSAGREPVTMTLTRDEWGELYIALGCAYGEGQAGGLGPDGEQRGGADGTADTMALQERIYAEADLARGTAAQTFSRNGLSSLERWKV